MFPNELYWGIAQYADIDSLSALSRTSSTFRTIAHRTLGERLNCTLKNTWRRVTVDKFFDAFYTSRGSICMGCKYTLATFPHPIFFNKFICRECITHNPQYQVISRRMAKSTYHFTDSVLKHMSSAMTMNNFTEFKKVDYWILKTRIQSLSYAIYKQWTPLLKDDALHINRVIGTRKRTERARHNYTSIVLLLRLGVSRTHLNRLKTTKYWYDNIHLCPKNPKLWLNACQTELDYVQ